MPLLSGTGPKRGKVPMAKFQVRLDRELLEQFEEVADQCGLSRNAAACIALQDFATNYREE